MNDFIKYSKKDQERDHAIIVFGFIQTLYNSGKINPLTFEAIKQKLGKNVCEGLLSQTFFAEEQSKYVTKRGRKEKELNDIENAFRQVDNGEIMVIEACKKLNIGRSTYYRRYRKWKAEQAAN